MRDHEINNSHILVKRIPEIKDLKDHCGLCEYHRMKDGRHIRMEGCEDCVINKENISCFHEHSYYHKWINDNDKESIEKLCKIVEKEYKDNKEGMDLSSLEDGESSIFNI